MPRLRFPEFKGEWEWEQVADLLSSVNDKPYQIQTSEYHAQGKFEVVDQGKNAVVGYSDLTNRLFTSLPIIVFGDHTTVAKYRDKPFIVGGDGVKLLKCRSTANHLQYLFYALLRYGPKPEGYKRHFTILKEKYLPVPTKDEQETISDFLALLDARIARIATQRKLVELLKKLKRGLLQSALADRNGNPKLRFPGFEGEWEVRSLDTFGDVLRGVSFDGATDIHTTETPRTIRLLRSNNVQEGQIVLDEVEVISRDCVAKSQIMRTNDILICMANGSKSLVGKAALFATYPQEYTFGAFMGVYRCHNEKDAYLVFLLLNTFKYRRELSILLSGSSINNLRPSDIASMRFHVPCGQEQMKLSRFLSLLDGRIAAAERMEVRLETVKRGLLQQLFA